MSVVEKMNSFISKIVVIKDTNDKEFEGKIIDCERPDDNELNENVIYFVAVTGEHLYISEHEISSIELKL